MGTLASNRSVVLLVLTVVTAVAVAPGIAAAESRAGGNIVVGPDEVVQGDLEVYGGSVVIHGTVDGDLRAFAGNVLIDGEVTGDVEVAAGNLDITGRVGGTVQASAGAVRLGQGATIGGNLDAAASSVVVNGAVGGNLRSTAEVTVLGSTSSVNGDVVYDGALRQNDAATVDGTIRVGQNPATGPPFFDGVPTIPGWVFGLYGFVANLLLGLFLLAVFPRFSDQVAQRALVNPVTAGGVGFLTLVGVPILLIVVAATIIGIPLALLGFLLYVGLLWVGGVYGRYAIGTWLLTFLERDGRWTALVVGLVAVGLVVRIPLMGTFLEILVFLLGLGAVTRAL
ncbi:MAG: polymer-forming cytoskeletal protein, partial [Halobacteriales archaeon]|nr:polymer-forming cytoskeletal protein [Halobacteriales archaeon]